MFWQVKPRIILDWASEFFGCLSKLNRIKLLRFCILSKHVLQENPYMVYLKTKSNKCIDLSYITKIMSTAACVLGIAYNL